MRAPSSVALLSAALVAAAAAPGALAQTGKPTPPLFVISGHGWGHGVGMPQYGALGYAKHGMGYRKILAHFYPHTALATTDVPQVRVLLADGRSQLTVSSKAAFRVRDATGASYKLAAGRWTFGPSLKLKVDPNAAAKKLPGPLLFTPGRSPLALDRPYRGSLRVFSQSGSLRAINVVGLEDYVSGVVPWEVPDGWPTEALKAQAVASRSYVVSTLKRGAFDVYADTRSQVYGGVDAETFATNAAVDATANQIVTYRGKPAITYFYASSGGRTAAIQDAWAGSRPVPYLVSVPDPWDILSPYHNWGPYPFDAATLAKKLGVSGTLLSTKTARNPSHRVTSLKLTTATGTTSLTGGDVRTRLGLRSSWFTVGELALYEPEKPLPYGVRSTLTGIASGLGNVWLERRSAGAWTQVAAVQKEADGTFTVPVKAVSSGRYRLSNGRVATTPLWIAAAPNVRLDAATSLSSLTGRMKPTLAGRAVLIQRLAQKAWKQVARTSVDSKGTFTARFSVKPGTYRALAPAGGGWGVATSATIRVLPASGSRYVVGVAPEASVDEVADQVAERTGARVSRDEELRAVFVRTPNVDDVRSVEGVAYVERAHARQLAFNPDDEFVSKQWYLEQIGAFNSWAEQPPLAGPRVALIDSGIDGDHPEFKGRIAAAKSFVGGSAREDSLGHGTFVAGEIGAALNNAQGIAGIAFPSQLLVAKVVQRDGNIPLSAEARALHWAIAKGAKVINLSLAGLRDPLHPRQDTYSSLEASAVRYAVRHGALVVAAVGNADQAPRAPWNFAGWPSALPHVVGVSALDRTGAVPYFSNRDVLYNDIAAPGADIFSTLPLNLTALYKCDPQGYSAPCGPVSFRHAEGTSFATPMVSAAAALVLASAPGLDADQVSWVLERSAVDVKRSTGCNTCPVGRDRLSGWGRLGITQALTLSDAGALPRADTREPNDDAGTQAAIAPRSGRLQGTLDFWDDPIDVYRLRLERGERLSALLRGPSGLNSRLILWRPGTRNVQSLSPAQQSKRVAQSVRAGAVQRIPGFRAKVSGWYYLEVQMASQSGGPYSLRYRKAS